MGLTSVEGGRYWIRKQIWHKFYISLETNMQGKHWACFIGYKEKGIFFLKWIQKEPHFLYSPAALCSSCCIFVA